ncbi:hypothetical protein WAX74_20200 [Psychrobacillus sp. FJAT-51614]|uniref:Uncharacterized protein n=1 Tax=Psychrobacillus mangrovi TaxID=3117745 RepID=A0ABU8FD13_9BACI
MSIEEQIHENITIRNIQPYLGKRKLPENLFIFGDSIVRESIFAFDENSQILELKSRNLKTIETYQTLNEVLREVFAVGKEMVEKKEFIEFQ